MPLTASARKRAGVAASLAALGLAGFLLNSANLSRNAAGVRGDDGGRRDLSPSERRRLCAMAQEDVDSLLGRSSPDASVSRRRLLSEARRRLEDLQCSPARPYVSQAEAVSLPVTAPVPDARNVPSHVALCENLFSNEELVRNGITPNVEGEREDEAVCLDWSSPLFSMMQIFASTLVAHAGASLGLVYRHDCSRTRAYAADEAAASMSGAVGADRPDVFDHTTIQQMFPTSSLVLDDNAVIRDDIRNLCKGCIKEYKTGEWDKHRGIGSRLTHHCLLYPGGDAETVQAYTFPEGTPESIVEEERKKLAAAIPLASVMPTVQDRLRLAAATWKSENGSPIPNEPLDGAVIVIDPTSAKIHPDEYTRHIPSSASSIQVLASPMCTSKSCLDHGRRIKAEMKSRFTDIPEDKVRFDIFASTAAAFSRMIIARWLICPPHSVTCLLPALAKEEGTNAVIFEDPARPLGTGWFDFVRQYESNIEVVQVGQQYDRWQAVAAGGYADVGQGGASLGAGFTTGDADHALAPAVGAGTSPLSPEDCIEVRGRAGSWEMDYDYDQLTGQVKTRGNTRGGVDILHTTSSRQQQQGGGGYFGGGLRSLAVVGDGTAHWNDASECDTALLDLNGVCEVTQGLDISRLFFTGDHYQQVTVSTFLEQIGLDPTIILDANGQFQKTVRCPNNGHSFEVVFTRNDLLDVADGQQVADDQRQFVAGGGEPAPPAVTNPSPDPYGSSTGFDLNAGPKAVTPGVIQQQYAGPQVVTQQQQYAQQQYVAPQAAATQYLAPQAVTQYSAAAPQVVMPQYAAAAPQVVAAPQVMYSGVAPMVSYVPFTGGMCACHPWVPSYQAAPPEGQTVVVAGTGATQQQDLQQFVNHFDGFRRLAKSVMKPDDTLVFRTTPPRHGHCNDLNDQQHAMSDEDVAKANKYTIEAIHEERRMQRARPSPQGAPDLHVLDVSKVTAAHPHATEEGMRALKCDGQTKKSSEIHEHWNHMFYSALKDKYEGKKAAGTLKQRPEQPSRPSPQVPIQKAPPQQAPPQQFTPQQQVAQQLPPQQATPVQQATQQLPPQQARSSEWSVWTPPAAAQQQQQTYVQQQGLAQEEPPQQRLQTPQYAQAAPQYTQARPQEWQSQPPAVPELQQVHQQTYQQVTQQAKMQMPGHRVVQPPRGP